MRMLIVSLSVLIGFARVHAQTPPAAEAEAPAAPVLISTAAVTSEPSTEVSTAAEAAVSTAAAASAVAPPKTMEELAARQAAGLKEFMTRQVKAKQGLEAQLQADRKKLEEEVRSLPMAERRKRLEELRNQAVGRREELRLTQAAEKEDFRLSQKRERDEFRKSRR